MNLLFRLACWVFGHAPVVARRGDDSVLVCERCGCPFGLFVAGSYAGRGPETGAPRKGPS